MKLAVTCVAALAICCSVRADFFPLGLWYEGGVGDARDNVLPADPAKAATIYDRNFADIAAHGINVIVVPNSPPEHHQIVLNTAQRHHLKVILELGLDGGPFGHMIRGSRAMDDAVIVQTLEKTLGPIKNHPALLRVQLLDEPPGQAFARYGKIAAAVRAFDPEIHPFCCLTGDSNGDAFLQASKSDVVAFDMYPIGPAVKIGDDKPLRDFATYAQRFADWASKYDAHAWAVVQCHDITGGLRFPTPPELRCMTWSALASGNKGVFWFLYQTESVGKDVLMSGLVDRNFKPRPLWDEVGKLTKELSPLLETLQSLSPAPDAIEAKSKSPILARKHTDGRGGEYVIVVNFDTLHPADVDLPTQPTLHLPPGGGELQRIK